MWHRPYLPALLSWLGIASVCGGVAQAALSSTRVASSLSRPVFVTAPAGDDRLFIVEQTGRIKILKNGAVLPTPFLDIHTLVPNIQGNDERGLLGLAFHPGYPTNGTFYIDYTDLSSNTVIARYHVSADPDSADPASAETVLTIAQPYTNHKGGTLLFGPRDGYLYIGMGDGGSEGDPGGRGQNTLTLLAKMLRIDVDHGDPYTIPPDNPFMGAGYLHEIWDVGVRNPYRWSFDRQTGDLYIADVGQDSWEEIDFEPTHTGGFNYGWSLMEGDHCYNPPQNCNNGSLTLPIYEYSHGGSPFRCAIVGGYVYRGSAIPSLDGTYFFADWCSAQIWSFRYDGQNITEFTDRTQELAPGGGLTISNISGFGEDGHAELYIVDRGTGSDGEVYKIVLNAAGLSAAPPEGPLELTQAAPNPFSRATRLEVRLDAPGDAHVAVFDPSGRRIRDLVDGPLPAGLRQITWDGADEAGKLVPTGIYFVRASAAGREITRLVERLR